MSELAARTVLVAGDVTVDWNIARARAHQGSATAYEYVWGSDIATRACSQPGGAALLTLLLEAVAADSAKDGGVACTVTGPSIPGDALRDPATGCCIRSYSVWSAHPQAVGEKKLAWRASEFWGSDAPAAGREPPLAPELSDAPWGIVLDDANLGFRDRKPAWPRWVSDPSPATSWLLLKMAHPVASGALWTHLADAWTDRLIVVVPVSDLRKGSLQIGYGLSWEQISGEIVAAITGDAQLSRAAAVVVPLGATGAVICDRASGNALLFDPAAQEDDWLRSHPGMSVGFNCCHVAGLVRHLVRGGDSRALGAGARRGIEAARALHIAGYGGGDGRTLVDLRFPVPAVVDALASGATRLAAVDLREMTPGWTILGRSLPDDPRGLAARVVRQGPEKLLGDIPLEKIGAWSSVDRTEIESIRSLRNIMVEYVAQAKPSRPLSIAVFGPPGAGKSFAIKQLARSLMPGRFAAVEFNLSQFDSHDELPGAFHRVRDATLRGELPLVFWDEFDTPVDGRNLGWLRYFLSPMQDGEFRESALAHPVGAAVFVFAGGVFSSLAGFRDAADANPDAKGKDFLSRLRGFLNILGPNPQGDGDEAFFLRRALLLRALFKMKVPQLFDAAGELQIDEGVLRALLEIEQYRHGARSAECIIDMSALSGKLKFERSCLPARHQLDLHVDAEKFLERVQVGR